VFTRGGIRPSCDGLDVLSMMISSTHIPSLHLTTIVFHGVLMNIVIRKGPAEPVSPYRVILTFPSVIKRSWRWKTLSEDIPCATGCLSILQICIKEGAILGVVP
jgi:hypothetical protein